MVDNEHNSPDNSPFAPNRYKTEKNDLNNSYMSIDSNEASEASPAYNMEESFEVTEADQCFFDAQTHSDTEVPDGYCFDTIGFPTELLERLKREKEDGRDESNSLLPPNVLDDEYHRLLVLEDMSDDESERGHFADETLTEFEVPSKLPPKKLFVAGNHIRPAAEQHLVCIMRENHLPIRVYKEIMDWAAVAQAKGYDFQSSPTYHHGLDCMKKQYNDKVGGPPIKCEPFRISPDFPPTHVFRNSLKLQVQHILGDRVLMEDFQWEYASSATTDTAQHKYGPPNTGTHWKQLEEDMLRTVGALEDPPPGEHRLCMIGAFDDSTICDKVGRMTAQPYLATILNQSMKVRANPQGWFILGMIPAYPKTSKEREKDRNTKASQTTYLKWYHRVLENILHEFHELEKCPQGHPFVTHDGKVVNLHFRFGFCIGDTKGHEDMCGHFNAQAAVLYKMLRDCNVHTLRGDDVLHRCRHTVQEDIADTVRLSMAEVNDRVKGTVTEARERVRKISHHLVEPVYWKFNYGTCPHGIFGCLPYEVLHLLYLGLMKYLLFAVFNFTTVTTELKRWYTHRCNGVHTHRATDKDWGGSVKRKPGTTKLSKMKKCMDQAEFERRFRIVCSAAKRQSDRDMPRCPFRNGVTNLT